MVPADVWMARPTAPGIECATLNASRVNGPQLNVSRGSIRCSFAPDLPPPAASRSSNKLQGKRGCEDIRVIEFMQHKRQRTYVVFMSMA